jgi:hypothetical protein
MVLQQTGCPVAHPFTSFLTFVNPQVRAREEAEALAYQIRRERLASEVSNIMVLHTSIPRAFVFNMG